MKSNVIHRNGGCDARILLSILVGLMCGLPARADYSSTVMSFNPIAYWRLNETGSTIDAAFNRGTGGSALNGSYVNSPPHGVIGALAGSSDTAVSFDGSSQRMLVPYASALNPAAPFTAEIWLNPAQETATNRCAISDGQFGSNRSGWLIYQQADAWNLRAYTGTGIGTSLNIASPATTAAANVWHHLVVVNDGATFTLYVDGVAAASGSASGYMTGQSGGTCIGSRADGPFFWPGTADELAIYPTALSADDVAAHYANGNDAGRTTPYETLVGNSSPAGYYRLDEPTVVFPTAVNVGSLGADANGTYSPGTVLGSAGPPNAELEAGNFSCLFDGTGDINCGNSPGFDVPQISIAAWIKVDVLGDYMSILAKGVLLWRFHMSAGATADKLEWLLETTTGIQSVTGNRSVVDGQWHHVVAVYDGANASIYLDGTLDNSKAVTGDMVMNTDQVTIGSQGVDPRWRWHGNIDEVAVFNYALSSSQVSQLLPPASISLVPGTSCLDASIVLSQPDFHGDVTITGPGAAPESLVFEVLNTCGAGDTYDFYLNGVSLGQTPANQSGNCTCAPPLDTFTVNDPGVIAPAWHVAGNNTFRFVKNGSGTYLAWARVNLRSGGFTKTLCLSDTLGGNCDQLDLCAAGYSAVPVDQSTTMAEPFTPPVLTVPYQDSLLPAHLDISALDDGNYSLCVSGLRPWETAGPMECLGFAKNGELKIIINGPGGCMEPANRPPVAKCRDVTVQAGASCSATASIDNGSYDPDGNLYSISQNPPGPYPIGTTPVQLLVTDSLGLSSGCQATVLVLPPLPTLPCPADILVGNDPGQCSAVVTYNVTAQGHCTLAAKGDVFLNADFTLGGGGFTVETPLPFDGPWVYDPASGVWHEDGQCAYLEQASTSLLISPVLTVSQAGLLSMELVHRYSFEPEWDGGQVQASVNGGPFIAVTEFTQNGYGGNTILAYSLSDLHGQRAFTGESPGYASGYIISTAILGSVNAGDTVRVRFMAASDQYLCGNVPNWEIRHLVLYQGGLRGDASVPVVCTPPSGSAFGIGTTRVFCTASDAFGQTVECSFTVTVEDREPPTIVCPADIALGCSVAALVPVTFTVTATDNCDPTPTVVCTPPSGSGFAAGVTTVHCTATDSSGNKASCSFKVIRAPLAFTGFLPPIGGADATGGSFTNPLRTFKMGSTIPVKFTAACEGSPVLSGVHRIQVVKYASYTGTQQAIDATPQDAATAGNQFRLAGGQWYFNLDTKATRMSVGKWLLLATLSDGSQHSVWIQLK